MDLDFNRIVFPIVILTDVNQNLFILSSGPKNISTETVDSGFASTCSCVVEKESEKTAEDDFGTDPAKSLPDTSSSESTVALRDCAFYCTYKPEHDLIEAFPAPIMQHIPRAHVEEANPAQNRRQRFLQRLRQFGDDTRARCQRLLSSAGKKIQGQLVREHESYSSHRIGTQDLAQGYRQQSQYIFKMF